jgi:RNA methyltransferase, TrmH family
MAKVEKLTSPANPLVKEVRKAVSAGGLTRDGCCIAETFHLLEEALRSGCDIQAVLAAASARTAVEEHLRGRPEVRLLVLADAAFRSLAATETSQGVCALVRPPAWTLEDLFRGIPLVVVLDGLQDPGNAGAIIRAAEAFRSSGLVFVKGAVNPYNPKAVRASAGSIFRVPLVHGLEAAPAQAALVRARLAVYATAAAGGRPAQQANLAQGCAIIIGSEGHGVSANLRAGATPLHIPTSKVESLNAAMAAGILLYEASRQRMVGR